MIVTLIVMSMLVSHAVELEMAQPVQDVVQLVCAKIAQVMTIFNSTIVEPIALIILKPHKVHLPI